MSMPLSPGILFEAGVGVAAYAMTIGGMIIGWRGVEPRNCVEKVMAEADASADFALNMTRQLVFAGRPDLAVPFARDAKKHRETGSWSELSSRRFKAMTVLLVGALLLGMPVMLMTLDVAPQ